MNKARQLLFLQFQLSYLQGPDSYTIEKSLVNEPLGPSPPTFAKISSVDSPKILIGERISFIFQEFPKNLQVTLVK
jgi:hypothetical protein